jgi:hypothetical protein
MALPGGAAITIDPQTHYVPTIGITSGLLSMADHRVDMVSYYAPLFRFARGGMKFKVWDPNSANAPLTSQIMNIGNQTTGTYAVSATYGVPGICDHPTISVPQFSGGAEYEMPYYNATHTSHVRTVSASTSPVTREATDSPLILVVSQGSTNFSTAARVYKAAADDFGLGFFIGVLPLCTNSALNPNG